MSVLQSGPPALAGVDVCICSYRRHQIVDTLAGLSHQAHAASFRIIIADNTREAAARNAVGSAARELGLQMLYVHAPADNISIARNACLDAARASWLAFLDDDEVPVAGWLAALLRRAARGDCDAVLGPVVAIYPNSTPGWLRNGNFHSTCPIWRGGEISAGYTGNVIIRRSFVRRHGLRFRIPLGTCGGEDEDFFSRFRELGGRLAFAPTAVCFERVSPERMTLKWLVRRNFRAGQSFARAQARRRGRPLGVLIAICKAGYCAIAAGLAAPHALRSRRYVVRAALHGGVAAQLMGIPEAGMRPG